MEWVERELLLRREEAYRSFQSRLIPGIEGTPMLGVRTPVLRQLAKEIPNRDAFLRELPHRYFEENQLHAFIINALTDLDRAMTELEQFLPYINNWATCDQLSPKAFRKNRAMLWSTIPAWLHSEQPYTVRFGIKMLMDHFLDEDFSPEALTAVCSVTSDFYYVQMMQAWFFATALAKKYTEAVPYLENRRLPQWVHSKTIQKAVESFRISPEQKSYLRTLR